MPRLKSLSLTGYKCFALKVTLELKPLTLVYGKNNVGKSSMLRALAVLARSVRESARGPWDLGDVQDPGRGAAFLDVVNYSTGLRRFSIELEWVQNEQLIIDEIVIEQDDPLKPAYIKSVFPEKHLEGLAWSRIPSDDPTEHIFEQADVYKQLTFVGLVPASGQDSALDRLAIRLKSLRNQVQWLHGGRATPPRSVLLKGSPAPKILKSDGEDASLKLVLEQHLVPEVNKFYTHSTISRQLRVNPLPPKGAELLLSPLEELWPVAISDTGEGMSKVLPILVSAATLKPSGPSLLLFEDPEAHLHDDAIRALADHLISSIKQGCSIIIETHSRTFLLAVQNAIFQKKLKPDQLNLVWADPQSSSHTELIPVKFDDTGTPLTGILADAFSTNRELAIEMLDK